MDKIIQEFSTDSDAKDINQLLMMILGNIMIEEDD